MCLVSRELRVSIKSKALFNDIDELYKEAIESNDEKVSDDKSSYWLVISKKYSSFKIYSYIPYGNQVQMEQTPELSTMFGESYKRGLW